VGNIGLVIVAVVRDPVHAIPLHGTFIGFPSDHLSMEAKVSVTSGTPKSDLGRPRSPISASPSRASGPAARVMGRLARSAG
jgi:hypothetical protein